MDKIAPYDGLLYYSLSQGVTHQRIYLTSLRVHFIVAGLAGASYQVEDHKPCLEHRHGS